MKNKILALGFALSFSPLAFADAHATLMSVLMNPAEAVVKRGGWYGFKGAEDRTEQEKRKYPGACQFRDVKIKTVDPITNEEMIVNVQDYITFSKKEDARDFQTIILLPPTGGKNAIDKSYAGYFCRRGFRTTMILSWNGDTISPKSLDVNDHDVAAIRSLAAIQSVFKLIEPRHKYQVGILGTSVGAIIGSFNMSLLNEINTGIFIVGGTDMAHIVATSDEIHLQQMREIRKKAWALETDVDYEETLRRGITLEPSTYTSLAAGKTIMNIINLADTTVPAVDQVRLTETFNHPMVEQVVFPYDAKLKKGHVGTVISAFVYYKYQMLQMFQKNLFRADQAPTIGKWEHL